MRIKNLFSILRECGSELEMQTRMKSKISRIYYQQSQFSEHNINKMLRIFLRERK